MSKRLEMLQSLTEKSTDPFAWYALAMEYAKLERSQEALATYAKLRSLHPDYVPMYLMAGQLLIQLDQRAAAAEWLRAGIGVAREKGDAHALAELETALAALG